MSAASAARRASARDRPARWPRRDLGPFSFSLDTHIHGLYQCGGSNIAPGINGVTNSGLNAAAAAFGCNCDDLLTATGQSLRIYPADDPSSWPEDLRPQ